MSGEEGGLVGGIQTELKPRGSELRRRWTLAAAITDEALSDEALVEQLENLRLKERMWQWEQRQVASTPFSPARNLSCSRSTTSNRSTCGHSSDHSSDDAEIVLPQLTVAIGPPPPGSATWRTARRALLACRELMRTEKHYLHGLRSLACSDTATDPPPILLAYLPKLISTSQALLDRMGKNPSAQGVADAFLDAEEDIETAFVGWCAIVGSVFVDTDGKSELAATPDSQRGRRVNSWSRKISSLRSSPANSTVNLLALDALKVRLERVNKPSVRELAILPTQRITRYTLLFKGEHESRLFVYDVLNLFH